MAVREDCAGRDRSGAIDGVRGRALIPGCDPTKVIPLNFAAADGRSVQVRACEVIGLRERAAGLWVPTKLFHSILVVLF